MKKVAHKHSFIDREVRTSTGGYAMIVVCEICNKPKYSVEIKL